MFTGPARDSTLPDALKALRKQLGYSQERLAQEIGTSRFRVIAWEKGESAPDSRHRQALIALGLPSEAFRPPAGTRAQVESRLRRLEGELAAIRALVQDWP